MSRVAPKNIKNNIVVAAIVFALAVVGIGAATYESNTSTHKVTTTTNSQHQLTYISYKGENGQNALALLKKHADVQTKHYSFGDLVTYINGSAGNGPKYWSFYINGKLATVGAGTYVTKDSDTLSWKLQAL